MYECICMCVCMYMCAVNAVVNKLKMLERRHVLLSFEWRKHTCFVQGESMCLCSPYCFSSLLVQRLLFLAVLSPDISIQIVRMLWQHCGAAVSCPADPARSKVYLFTMLLLYWACLYIKDSCSHSWGELEQLLRKKMQYPLVIYIFWTAGLVSGNSHLHSRSRSYFWCESPCNNTLHAHDTKIQNWLN